jgi:uncharacterized integral membrane protein
MGIALILLGLVAAGIVVDFAVENWSKGTADLTFALFGGSFTLTQIQVVIGAAVLGGVAVVLCMLGARFLRVSRGRHRTARGRVSDLERGVADLEREVANLERENAALKERRVEIVDEETQTIGENGSSQKPEDARSPIEP